MVILEHSIKVSFIILFTYTLFPNTRVLVNYESGVNETIYIYESLIYFDDLDNDIFIDSLTVERSKIDIEIKSPKYLKFVTSKDKVFYFNIIPDEKLELKIDDDKQIVKLNQRDIKVSEIDKLTEILSDSIANSNLSSCKSLLLYQEYLEKLPNSFTFSSFFFLQNSIYPLDENDFKKLLIGLNRSRMNDTYYKVSLLLFLQEIINFDLDSSYKMEILEIIKSKMESSQEKSTVLYLENKLLRELGLKDVDETNINQYSLGENSLLYFSASWCQPCIEAVDSVQKAIRLLKERNPFSMRIFSLESDNSKQLKLEKIYGKENVYILENASEHPLAKYFNVNSVPTIIILKNKRIQSRNLISPLELPGYINRIKH